MGESPLHRTATRPREYQRQMRIFAATLATIVSAALALVVTLLVMYPGR